MFAAFLGLHKHLVLCSSAINIIPVAVGRVVNSPSGNFMGVFSFIRKGRGYNIVMEDDEETLKPSGDEIDLAFWPLLGLL